MIGSAQRWPNQLHIFLMTFLVSLLLPPSFQFPLILSHRNLCLKLSFLGNPGFRVILSKSQIKIWKVFKGTSTLHGAGQSTHIRKASWLFPLIFWMNFWGMSVSSNNKKSQNNTEKNTWRFKIILILRHTLSKYKRLRYYSNHVCYQEVIQTEAPRSLGC